MAVQILLIDANIGFIVRLKRALEDQEYEVRTVGRPKAALAALTQSRFDVAVIDLHLEGVANLVTAIRQHQPELPIIFSGSATDDPEKVGLYKGQAYIHKPYVARDLIPIIERTRHEIRTSARPPATPKEAPTRPDRESQIFGVEPPVDDEATIGDVFSSLVDLDIEAEIIREVESGGEQRQQPLPPDTLPEAPGGPQPGSSRTYESPAGGADSPAAAALRLSNDEALMDTMLMRAQSGESIVIHPLPSWNRAYTPQELAQLEVLLGSVSNATDVENPPYGAVTQPYALPEIDLLPDPEDTTHPAPRLAEALYPELLDALAESNSTDDPRLQAVLQEMVTVPPEEEPLVAATVDEITQAMGVVLSDEDEAAVMDTEPEFAPDAAAVSELLSEIDVVARAALQLTQLSLESTALGTLLTHQYMAVARTGTFSEATWDEILEELAAGWQREGNARTRILYRSTRELGQIMLYSTRTVDDLTLTMIFAADTPLRIIRRQAGRLSDALSHVPEIDAGTSVVPAAAASPETPIVEAEPVVTTPIEVEQPPAAITTPSRPTDLHPPEALRQTLAETVTEKPQREPGSYTGYACLWVLKNEQYVLTNSLADAMKRWIRRTAETNDWDMVDVEVGPTWVNLHIEVPLKAVPGQVIQTFMSETQRYVLETSGDVPDMLSIWAGGYSVTTPGRLLTKREIERFMRYQAEQGL